MDNAKILRVALYPRVSTEEQVMQGYSLQTQEEALTAYAQEHGYKIVGVYRDEGHSARKAAMQRPMMLQLLKDVEAGKIDRILFIKLDRWFRNVREYHKVQAILDAHNVSWQAILEDYNTSTADGRLKVNIMLSVAENESDRTSERIKFVFDGKRRRKEWCFPGGPAHWPYGYVPAIVDGVKRCVKNPETAPIVQDFWDYVAKYDSVRKASMYVAEKYGITRHYRSWTITSRNELYTGTFHGVEDYCPAYVSREVWERINIEHNLIKKTPNPNRIYLFTGLIRCPCCGNTLKATFYKYPNDRTVEYNGYRCNNHQLRQCEFSHQISERKVEKYLLEHIEAEMRAYVLRSEAAAAKKRQQPQVQDLVVLNEQLRRLNVIYLNGSMDDTEYMQETKRLKSAIEKARAAAQSDRPPDLTVIKQFLATDLREVYKSLNKEDQRRLWRSLIEEIYVEGNQVTGIKLRV